MRRVFRPTLVEFSAVRLGFCHGRMANCAAANCTCKNLYTDWAIGQRTGICEDCEHLKTEHSREQQAPAQGIHRVPVNFIEPSHIFHM